MFFYCLKDQVNGNLLRQAKLRQGPCPANTLLGDRSRVQSQDHLSPGSMSWATALHSPQARRLAQALVTTQERLGNYLGDPLAPSLPCPPPVNLRNVRFIFLKHSLGQIIPLMKIFQWLPTGYKVRFSLFKPPCSLLVGPSLLIQPQVPSLPTPKAAILLIKVAWIISLWIPMRAGTMLVSSLYDQFLAHSECSVTDWLNWCMLYTWPR